MNKLFAILSLLSFSTALNAQASDKYMAWVDVQQTDGKVVISCWCQNNTSSSQYLQYKAILVDNDSIVREGKTLTLPEQPNLLLNGNFLVEDGQFDKLFLFVYKNNELVASAQAFGPKAPNIATEQVFSGNESQGFDDSEIDGLVLDETRSKLAHDFYELFYNGWTTVEEDIKINYEIIIREQPNVIGIGSRIIVEVDGQELTQLNLQPRAEVVESLASQLVESLYNYFTNPDDSVKELKLDDISGSGIY